ncbi:MAG: hypothetical protein ACM33B_10835 [Pseudomonadota bacterium]
MAVDAATPTAAATQAVARPRPIALPAHAVLGLLVAASAGARWLLGAFHATPSYLPDEYIYPTLSQAIAATGVPRVRGDVAAFPAILEPLLAAPAWLLGDPSLAYTLTQGLHAVAISLAAVPAYALARRVGVTERLALAVAALALVWPGLTYAGWMLADPIAYPLMLAAVYAAVRALDEGTLRWQAAFLGAAGLVSLARMQYVVLPAVFLAAALVVERFSPRRTLRLAWPTLVLLLLPVLGGLVLGPTRILGYYGGITKLHWEPARIAQWFANDLMVLAYAAGWVLVPGALVGLALALVRPRTRAELAFAATATLLTCCVVGQAALYSANGDDSQSRVHERYGFGLLTLLAIAFALWVSRGRRAHKAAAFPAVALLLLSVLVPLSGFTAAQGKTDSPTLRAVSVLEAHVGIANASLVVAVAAGVLALLAVLVALTGPRAAWAAVGATVAACTALTVGAYAFDRINTTQLVDEYFEGEPAWVADAAPGPVSLLQLPGSDPGRTLMQLFWNRNVDRVLLLGSMRPDNFQYDVASVTPDGRLVADGEPLGGTLLIQRWASYAELEHVERIARRPDYDLVRTTGVPRVRLLVDGLFADGWLAPAGAISVWPRRAGEGVHGTLRLRLSMPRGAGAQTLDLHGSGVDRRVVVPGGGSVLVALPMDTDGVFRVRYGTDGPGWLGNDRRVSVRMAPPSLAAGERDPSGGGSRSA